MIVISKALDYQGLFYWSNIRSTFTQTNGNVNGQSAIRSFFVFAVHVFGRVPHGVDDFVEGALAKCYIFKVPPAIELFYGT
jgi:hypothetical protein